MTEELRDKHEALRVFAAAAPFLLSIGFLGFAISNGVLVKFAIAWPLIQIAGYTMSLRMAKGDIKHPLVNAQIALHWLVLLLLIAVIVRAL